MLAAPLTRRTPEEVVFAARSAPRNQIAMAPAALRAPDSGAGTIEVGAVLRVAFIAADVVIQVRFVACLAEGKGSGR